MVRRRFERIAAAFGRLSLTAKGVLVVAVPVAALLVSMSVFYRLQEQNRKAQSLVEHTFQVRSEIARLMLSLSRAETSTRGYMLTRDNTSAERFQAAVAELSAPLENLQQLVADNPAQTQRLAQLKSQIAAAVSTMETARRDAGAGEPAVALSDLETSRAQTRQLRSDLESMQAQENRLLSLRGEQARQTQQKLGIAIFAGGLLGLLGGLMGAMLFGTGIVRRVHQLESGARQMAEGMPFTEAIEGGDELSRLGRTLQQSSLLLASQREELHAAQSELEARVRRRTRELTDANEALRQANELRQTLLQSSPVAIWALDLNGNVTFWNPAAERAFGYSEAEVLGQRPPIVPDDQRAEYEQWIGLFRGGGSLFEAERIRRKKDGARINVLIWTAPLRDAQGHVTGTLVIDSDITDRKLLEEQFRQSQKLEAVGRLAGGVAHDFNNLLTVIIGYVEMLIGEAGHEPNLVEYAQEIQHAATRAAGLTAQLLAFSRRQVSQPKVMDINAVVTRAMRMLQRVIGEDVEITTHLDPRLGTVKADPTHLDQLLMNLVVNARDAMTHGGRITIDTANVELDEHYVGRHIGVQPGPYALLAVSDTGTGMTPEIKSRLFEPFFTTKEAGKGTGLGLSIVYGIVKQNSGEIMVYSEPGQGTTFKVYLPLTEVPAEMAAAENQSEDTRGTETVLLCEDEPAIRKLVFARLTKNGYHVLEAETPTRAIEICRDYPGDIHLLFTDIVMPRISGFELAETVLDMRPLTKVLYMSGYTDNRVSASWVFDPSTPFLHKPFTVSALVHKVREALAGNGSAAN
ncbi:MAG TPA: PAS domain S-box protein [Candidatus Sulfopaludibacter sp.]|jgi:PAS domain S-box-containing protein|nr:PAS domain S-box protein [Candidatus Sulfopaludibacter sp.]